MSIGLAVAAFLWTVSTFVVAVPWRQMSAAPSLLFLDEWPGDCTRLHGRAQASMRRVFGVLAAAAGLGSAIAAFQTDAGAISPQSLVVVVLVVLLTIVGARHAAAWWEGATVRRHAEWLRAAEAAKYHVAPVTAPATESTDGR